MGLSLKSTSASLVPEGAKQQVLLNKASLALM